LPLRAKDAKLIWVIFESDVEMLDHAFLWNIKFFLSEIKQKVLGSVFFVVDDAMRRNSDDDVENDNLNLNAVIFTIIWFSPHFLLFSKWSKFSKNQIFLHIEKLSEVLTQYFYAS